MVYVGSKRKLATAIVKIITENLKQGGDFIDMFCGGCSVSEALTTRNHKIYCNDGNPYLIALYKKGQGGWTPDLTPYSREFVNKHRTDKSDLALTGECTFLYGFRGSVFGYSVMDEDGNNYYLRKRTSFLKTINSLKQATFSDYQYQDYPIHNHDPENTLIYCDPPYLNTRIDGYGLKTFDHNRFWNWVKQVSEQGYRVLVSELSAPQGFISIRDFPYKHYLRGDSIKSLTERLFVLESQLYKWKVRKSLDLSKL